MSDPPDAGADRPVHLHPDHLLPDHIHPVRSHSAHSADVVARIAAHHARRAPGVVALRPGRNRAVAALVGRLAAGAGRDTPPVDGVSVRVDGGRVDIELDIAVAFGAVCVEVVSRLQREVGDAVRRATGLASTIAVVIVDVGDDWGGLPPPGL